MSDTKKCPYCAEEIRAEAVRCRHCRSRLAGFDLFIADRWHRDHEDARLAGVCAALAHTLAMPASLVRLGFIVLSFVHLVGVIVYAALWLIIPAAAGQESLLEVFLAQAQALARRMRGDGAGQSSPPAAPANPGQAGPQ